jgi:hypothetical protein
MSFPIVYIGFYIWEREPLKNQFTISTFYYRDSQVNYSIDMNVGPSVIIPFFCPKSKKLLSYCPTHLRERDKAHQPPL